MDADILTLRDLFSKDVRYVVPPFQRPYVWTLGDQWEPLWDDVSNTAERYLDALAETGGRPAVAEAATRAHFLGAVVAQQELTSSAEPEKRRVIDGQQRLTTLQLLLDAAQEVFEHRECGAQARRLRTLVLNNDVFIEGDPDFAFKVWPTTEDQDAFRQAMRNELLSEEYGESRIVRAHEYFKEQISGWLDEEEAPESRAGALEVALTGRLQMAVIDLEQDDDPHMIFETLNSRGTPLLDSDLVKNFLMYEASRQGGDTDALHASYLGMFEEPWWREEVRQGRIFRPRVDVFLNYWLVMRRSEEVSPNDVFKAFGDHARGHTGAVQEIAADLHRIGQTYKALEETDDASVLGRFLYRWRVMQAGVVTPVLMWLLSQPEPELSRPRLEKSLRALESYLVRRMVCRMTTKDYNRITLDLLGRLHAEGPARADETLINHLKSQEAESRLWPDDRRLEDSFLRLPLYRLLTRARLRLVLEGVEEHLRTGKAEESTPPRNLTIEHTMPQSWPEHWALDVEALGNRYPEANEQRVHAVQTIGNLTLATQPLNSSVRHGPWPVKRDALAEHSVLHLNKDLLAHAEDGWDEDAIEERARRLAKAAAALWPPADAF